MLLEKLNKFIYDQELFEKMLVGKTKHSLAEETCCIVLGNRESKKIVTIVFSLYCPFCSELYEEIEKGSFDLDEIQLRIVFRPEPYDIQTVQYLMN